MTQDMQARVQWALTHYATAKPAEMAQIIRELWEESQARETEIARLATEVAVADILLRYMLKVCTVLLS